MTDGRPAPPGWYPDPEQPARLRWWDGTTWTTQYTTTGAHPAGRRHRGLPDISDWMRDLFRTLWHRSGQLAALAFVFALVPAVLLAAAAWAAIGDVEVVDEQVVGWERADLVPLVLAAVLYLLATLGFAQAAGHQLLSAMDGQPVAWQRSVPPALRSLLRLVGYGAVLAVGLVAVTAVVALVGVAAPLLLVLVVPALLVAGVWLYVQLNFVPVAALGTAPGTNLFRSSTAISAGRFWAVLGRLALLALVGTTAGIAFNVVTIPLQSTATIDATVIQTDGGALEDFAMRDVVPNAGALGVAIVLATLVQSAQTAVGVAGQASLYRDGGGSTELLDATTDDGGGGGTPTSR